MNVMVHDVPLLERNGARKKFIDGDADGIQVGTVVDLSAKDLFRRHVEGGPGHLRMGLSTLRDGPCKSEIGDLHKFFIP